jgi:lysophospholipase L1-like esterase
MAWLVSIVALGGCGEGSAARVKAPPPDVGRLDPPAPADVFSDAGPHAGVTLPTPSASPAPSLAGAASPSPVPSFGHLEGTRELRSIFASLAALSGPGPHDDVRILQFGDSHTASDTSTAVVRRLLQARFGDGGRGFVEVGLPWKNYIQDGVRGQMTKEFEPQRPRSDEGRSPRDGSFGLLGIAIGTDKPGARAWSHLTAPSSRIEVDYWTQPRGGSFDVLVDGTSVGRVASRGTPPASGFAAFDVTEKPHDVEIRATGDGPIRVFGLALDRGHSGVVVDALGINGAQITWALRWNEEHFAEQLRHRAPALVLLAYGTNEALDPHLDLADYEQSLHEMLGRVRHAVPGVPCVLVGPPDLARPRPVGNHEEWATWPPVLDVIAVQRRVAASEHLAFYDQLGAMGGPGSMAAWASEADPRAQGDRVHMTGRGYAALATSFVNDFLSAYEAWLRTPEAGSAPGVAVR